VKEDKDGEKNKNREFWDIWDYIKMIWEPEYHLLVGESYVDGLMRGEAVEQLHSKEKLLAP